MITLDAKVMGLNSHVWRRIMAGFIREITDDNIKTELAAESVLVDFWSVGCGLQDDRECHLDRG